MMTMIDLFLGIFVCLSVGCCVGILYESELMISEIKKKRDGDE